MKNEIRTREQKEFVSLLPTNTFQLALGMRLGRHEVRKFRAALLQVRGMKEDLFHNHVVTETGKLLNLKRYPRIQFRSEKGKAVLYGIAEGAEALKTLSTQLPDQLRIGRDFRKCPIAGFREDRQSLRLCRRPRKYRIQNWLALGAEDFRAYRTTISEAQRLLLLEARLRHQLFAFLLDLGLEVHENLHTPISRLRSVDRQNFRNISFLSFSLSFRCNAVLPPGMGLGRGASEGQGLICPV